MFLDYRNPNDELPSSICGSQGDAIGQLLEASFGNNTCSAFSGENPTKIYRITMPENGIAKITVPDSYEIGYATDDSIEWSTKIFQKEVVAGEDIYFCIYYNGAGNVTTNIILTDSSGTVLYPVPAETYQVTFDKTNLTLYNTGDGSSAQITISDIPEGEMPGYISTNSNIADVTIDN